MDIDLLYIEDDLVDAELVFHILDRQQVSTKYHLLRDGEEALDFFFNQAPADYRLLLPKVILLDVKLPKLSGLEVLEKLKTDERTKQIPVIMFSSSNQRRDVEKAYELGANGYLVKPSKLETLRNVLQCFCEFWLDYNER